MLQGMTAHYLVNDTFPLSTKHTALIHAAAGGVGLLFCQLARRRGARVIGTVGGAHKVELARTAGADEVIDYRSARFVDEVMRLTGGAGVDVVYDSVGKDTFDDSLKCLRPRGMMVLFGAASGPVPPFELQRLSAGGSLFITRPTLASYVPTHDQLVARAESVLTAVQRGELALRIEAALPLAQAAEAHTLLTSRKTTGKLLLIP
jgi:NADPH2:quinone reductase